MCIRDSLVGATTESKAIVPDTDSSYSLGTNDKRWTNVFTDNVNAGGTITGNLTGNVTGNVTGDVTGNVDGNVSGEVTLEGAAPASATATGTAGDIRYDADYIYICVATDTWKRAAISTWS